MKTFSTRAGRTLILGGVALSVLLGASGCRRSQQVRSDRAAPARSASAHSSIILDGRFEDWSAASSTFADSDWVYFRVAIDGQAKPIQSADSTLALWLDADDNGNTGIKMPAPKAAASIGVDLIVEFSPQDSAGHASPGIALFTANTAHEKVPLTRGQLEVEAAPTVASSSYEIRISRRPDAAASPDLARLLAGSGKARGMFVLVEGGKIVGWSDPESFSLPRLRTPAALPEADPPAKPAGAIRVLSYNVHDNSPDKNPGPFIRLFEVTKPDVILLQEWNKNQASAQAWFTAQVSGESRWNAAVGAGGDVLIVSPHPIAALTTGPVTAAGADKPARFASAVVKTPAGDVAVGTVHLKCCGTAGSKEDQTRIAEAAAVQNAMKAAFAADKSRLRIIGGDFNLVGTATPLDRMAAGLDFDGSPLVAAEPLVLGDNAEFTWTNDAEVFPPGRLDYILFSGSSADIVGAFVLDTRRLGGRSLARLGLDKADSAASDHLPVIVDFKPR
jgi:endonuclease/exonuclease/phosphatase family metal-dependent hydrolase